MYEMPTEARVMFQHGQLMIEGKFGDTWKIIGYAPLLKSAATCRNVKITVENYPNLEIFLTEKELLELCYKKEETYSSETIDRLIEEGAGTVNDPMAIHIDVTTEIHALTSKTSPVAADEVVGENSESGWSKIRMPISSILSVGASFKINYIIDGGGSAITTGSKGFIIVPKCTIQGWVVLADQSGSIVVDVKRATYSGFPTMTSIAGSEKPTLSTVQKNQDMSLTTWTDLTLDDNDILEFYVDSATTVTRVTVTLVCIKTV
jgi:hypothetical protein